MLDLLKGSYYCRSELAGFILSAFSKLTDPDSLVSGQEEEATLFVESLVKSEALDVFVSALRKFPVDNAFIPVVQTITHMIYLKPELAGTAGQKPKLMAWVLRKLRSPKWNDLKMYAVGFLNTLLMNSVENRFLFGEEVVVVVVNALSSIQEEEVPHSREEHLLQNHLLQNLLECPANIESFAKAGGVQSVIGFIILEEDFGHCYGSAIVALDIAVQACQSASQEFVTDDSAFDDWTFDTVFPPSLDMIPLNIMHDEEEIEEHQISLIASLICGIAKTEKDSLLKKFEENDFKRITWCMELYKRYSGKVEAMTNHLKGKQSVDVLLGFLWSSENSTIQSRIKSHLTRHNLEMKNVEDSLSAYRDNIGNAGESVESPKTAMEECIDSLEENPDERIELDGKDKPRRISGCKRRH